MSNGPPKWAMQFLRWYCRKDLYDAIEGDLLELYNRELDRHGKRKANRVFIWNVTRFFQPFAFKRQQEQYSQLNRFYMFTNYFKIASRHFLRSKLYSFINITGLALGICATLVIVLLIRSESSFDKFHSKYDKLGRVSVEMTVDGSHQTWAGTQFPLAPRLTDDFPEIRSSARVFNWGQQRYEIDSKELFVDQTLFADDTFFELFDFPIIYGNKKTALSEPNQLVISTELSERLFGGENPIGKTINIANSHHLVSAEEGFKLNTTVSAVVEVPKNSHLQFDGIVSMKTKHRFDLVGWGGVIVVTYCEIDEQTDFATVNSKIGKALSNYARSENPQADNFELTLQPMKDIHLSSGGVQSDALNYAPFKGEYLPIFGALAAVILLISCVNFINISMANFLRRTKEVGVRKCLGATQKQIKTQFMTETLLTTMLAGVLAIALTLMILPSINGLISKQLELSTFLAEPTSLMLLIGGLIFTGLLSGIYPALNTSRLGDPSRVGTTGRESRNLKNGLLVFQFSAALSLTIAAILISSQLNYLRSKDLGFERDQIVSIPLPANRTASEKYKLLQNELSGIAGIVDITGANSTLGGNVGGLDFKIKKGGEEQKFIFDGMMVDDNFPDFFGIDFKIRPKILDKDKGQDFIVNEAFIKEMGWNEDPVGEEMGYAFFQSWGRVSGVISDFNYNNLKTVIQPFCLWLNDGGGFSKVFVKIDSKELSTTLGQIEDKWKSIVTDIPYQLVFIDDFIEKQYDNDKKIGSVVSLITVLGVSVALLGLFGLASLMLEYRVKEMGIKKVLGATTLQIFFNVSLSYLKLIGLAFMIAIPITYFLISNWLRDFAYRIEIDPLVIIASGLGMAIVAILTISYQTAKAARTNPIDNLRCD